MTIEYQPGSHSPESSRSTKAHHRVLLNKTSKLTSAPREIPLQSHFPTQATRMRLHLPTNPRRRTSYRYTSSSLRRSTSSIWQSCLPPGCTASIQPTKASSLATKRCRTQSRILFENSTSTRGRSTSGAAARSARYSSPLGRPLPASRLRCPRSKFPLGVELQFEFRTAIEPFALSLCGNVATNTARPAQKLGRELSIRSVNDKRAVSGGAIAVDPI